MSGFDNRHSVSDDDGDVGYPGPVSVRGRELHRAHVPDTAGRVRALAGEGDMRDGLHHSCLIVVRVQEERVDDISRKLHDTHLSGGRADGKLTNDLVDERQQAVPVSLTCVFYASRVVNDDHKVHSWIACICNVNISYEVVCIYTTLHLQRCVIV